MCQQFSHFQLELGCQYIPWAFFDARVLFCILINFSADLSCHLPPSVDSRLMIKGHTVSFAGGATFAFACPQPLVVRGSATVRCRSTGSWNSTMPSCVKGKHSEPVFQETRNQRGWCEEWWWKTTGLLLIWSNWWGPWISLYSKPPLQQSRDSQLFAAYFVSTAAHRSVDLHFFYIFLNPTNLKTSSENCCLFIKSLPWFTMRQQTHKTVSVALDFLTN